MTDISEQRFQNGSTTYFTASRFFPPEIRDDITKLYAFLRVADDFVDELPQRKDKLDELEWAWHGGEIDDPELTHLARQMREIAEKYDFDNEWVTVFFNSMRMDLVPARTYATLAELDEYMYGSAEVVGLMMARIFGLNTVYDQAARYQGSAMQLMNFIRDIKHDAELGRCYIPTDMLLEVGLAEISMQAAEENEPAFTIIMKRLIDEYHHRQQLAHEAFGAIPMEYRAPLLVAVDGYNYTARIIEHMPMIVWQRKVKPPKWWLLLQGARRRFL